ncbi:transposase (fragment) [Xenorhabdus innexi]|uniref:Transposase n=1 Tax=Xenorhabdus innexi TaxID=290109 RepID=A0A1N6N0J2_9GAMM
MKNGARKTEACQVIGISIRTLQRWTQRGIVFGDKRTQPRQIAPYNQLSQDERQTILTTCNSPEFADLTPNLIVPTLADRGIYLASESTFYRVLKSHNQLSCRTRSKPKGNYKRPHSQKAVKPNQVWTWDISYLPSTTKGKHFYLYMIVDIFSRKIVGADVYRQESGDYAAELLQRSVWSEKCINNQLVLHSDSGGPMRSYTLLAKMQDLGVITSYSRPRVSNDNPYSESLFKTVKYCPQWPQEGFFCIEGAQYWVDDFVK